ncbi:MAG: alpha/beta hydrolase [Thiotrichales bacterium]|nr:alpha/beta hydrolase [Thiotrichales bacterium]
MTAVPVDPQIRQVIDALAASEFEPVHALTPSEARAQYNAMVEARGITPAPVGAVEDRALPGPGGDLPVRIYRPDLDGDDLPALVYFHGGGHVIGSPDTHDATARNLCNGARCVVMSVDYRLAPEHKFPAAAEDAFAAVRWCAAHSAEIGIDPRRIAVGGDSAGGNLAAVAALMAREVGGPAIQLQVLVYPVTDYACDTASYHIWATGYVLEAASMRWFRDHYLRNAADRRDWRAAPLRAADLSDLPPALVLTVPCDVLHDEGEAYAQRLRAAGVEVEYHRCNGMIHGFFTMAPAIDGAVRAQALVCKAMKDAFAHAA